MTALNTNSTDHWVLKDEQFIKEALAIFKSKRFALLKNEPLPIDEVCKVANRTRPTMASVAHVPVPADMTKLLL